MLNKSDMDIQAEKLSLMRSILDIEDMSVIRELKSFFKQREHDWFDDLSEEQQESVDQALAELDRGEGIPHEEAMRWLGL